MCRAAGLALALSVVAGGAALRAQLPRGSTPHARALLARAESLETQLARRDTLNRRASERQRVARRFGAGDVVVLLGGVADEAVGAKVAAAGAALLDSLGILPVGFVRSRVVVAYDAAGVDSVARAEGLVGRARVLADFGRPVDTLAGGFVLASALVRAYQEGLDSTWRSWAPGGLSLDWKEGREGEAARLDLLTGNERVGARCLAGEISRCALWLGVDRDAHPFRTRYAPDELRRVVASSGWTYGANATAARDCVQGSDDACVRFAESDRVIDATPAGGSARGSLLREIWAVHGRAALGRALADTSGSVAERLARAAGLSEDALLVEWRAWLLTGGGGKRVTAEVADALPVVVFGALLLFAAARSGRWR